MPFLAFRVRPTKMRALAGLIPSFIAFASLINPGPSHAQQKGGAPSSYSAPVPGETLDAIISPAIAISPDATRIVFVAASANGGRQLFIRPVRATAAAPIAGTDGAENPVFSPDGKWIAFVAFGKRLQKVPATGGPVVTLCEITQPRGLSWGTDDIITITPALSSGLMQISPAGGTPRPLTTLKGERSHRWPDLSPDGKTVFYVVPGGDSGDEGKIIAERVGTDQRRVLVDSGTQPHYSAGHLLYVHSGSLLAAPFDPALLELTGKPEKVLDHVLAHSRTGAAHYSITPNGTLAYVLDPGGEGRNTLVWVDRNGSSTPLPGPQRPYEHPRLSPDAKRVVYSTPDEKVFVFDIDRNQFQQLSPEARNEFPVWTPDGKRVAFLSNRSGSRNVWWVPIDGSGPAEQLTNSKNVNEPSGWSSDGRFLLVTDQAPQTNRNILLAQVADRATNHGDTEVFLETPADESAARFSPNGHWIVYYSNETGKSEIYVKPFPATEKRWKISTDGGSEPVWSPTGNEIFYRNGDKMMSAEVKATPGCDGGTAGRKSGTPDSYFAPCVFAASAPRLLFEGNYRHGVTFRPDYDVTPDGKRFLMVRGSEQPPGAAQITVVPNWTDKINPQK